MSWPAITPPNIFEKVAQNDEAANEVFDEFLTVLAQALAGIVNTIDVEEIILGGGLSEVGASLLEPLKKKLENYIFPQIRPHFSVKKALLGNDAGVYGAAYYYLSKNAV